MRIAFTLLVAAHGLLHLLGAFKAFGWAQVAQLRQPITRPLGVLWLSAAILLLATATALLTSSTWWWVAALPAVAVSQVAIATSWGDARFGTLANLIVLGAVALNRFGR